jgi:hypothetical protein
MRQGRRSPTTPPGFPSRRGRQKTVGKDAGFEATPNNSPLKSRHRSLSPLTQPKRYKTSFPESSTEFFNHPTSPHNRHLLSPSPSPHLNQAFENDSKLYLTGLFISKQEVQPEFQDITMSDLTKDVDPNNSNTKPTVAPAQLHPHMPMHEKIEACLLRHHEYAKELRANTRTDTTFEKLFTSVMSHLNEELRELNLDMQCDICGAGKKAEREKIVHCCFAMREQRALLNAKVASLVEDNWEDLIMFNELATTFQWLKAQFNRNREAEYGNTSRGGTLFPRGVTGRGYREMQAQLDNTIDHGKQIQCTPCRWLLTFIQKLSLLGTHVEDVAARLACMTVSILQARSQSSS